MKKIILLIVIFSFLLAACTKDKVPEPIQYSCDFIGYKYYKGAKDTLGELSNNYILVGIDTSYSDNEIRSFISTIGELDQNYAYTIHSMEYEKFKEIPLKLTNYKTCEEITRIISELEQHEIVAYAHYTMKTDNCQSWIMEPMGNLCIDSYASTFYVKVFDTNDLTDLNETIAETNTELVEQNLFMSQWFRLRATKKSKGDALKMANYFYETGHFEATDPELSKYAVE